MAECRSCGAAIRWVVTTKNGKHMPVDIEPVASGSLVIEYRNGGHEARPATDADRKLGRELFTSHFATCKQAATWRNRE